MQLRHRASTSAAARTFKPIYGDSPAPAAVIAPLAVTGARRRALQAATALAALALGDTAFAGGLNAQRGMDLNPLFNAGAWGLEVGTYHGESERDYINARGINRSPSGPIPATGATTATSSISFDLSSAHLYARLGDNASCMARAFTPYYGKDQPGTAWAGRHVIEQLNVDSDGVDVACRYGVTLANGNLVHFIGGWRSVALDLNIVSTAPSYVLGAEARADTRLSPRDRGDGWRAGVAYEIPKYKARVSLLYTAPIALDMQGQTIYDTGSLRVVDPKTMSVRTPRQVELSLQSGLPVAGGILGWANIRYEDWSQDWKHLVSISPITPPEVTDLGWSDGLTVELGAAKPISRKLSFATSVTWDKEMAQDIGNSYGASAVLIYALNDHLSLKFATSARYLEGSTGIEKKLLSARMFYDVRSSWSYGYGVALALDF